MERVAYDLVRVVNSNGRRKSSAALSTHGEAGRITRHPLLSLGLVILSITVAIAYQL